MPKRAYYYHHDFFTMSNDEELTILQNFKTFQQTENYTCGPVCVQMILEYYKDKVQTKEEVKKEQKSKKKKGTEIVNIVNFFKKKKYEIDCSLTRKSNKEGYIFPDFLSFSKFCHRKSKTRISDFSRKFLDSVKSFMENKIH